MERRGEEKECGSNEPWLQKSGKLFSSQNEILDTGTLWDFSHVDLRRWILTLLHGLLVLSLFTTHTVVVAATVKFISTAATLPFLFDMCFSLHIRKKVPYNNAIFQSKPLPLFSMGHGLSWSSLDVPSLCALSNVIGCHPEFYEYSKSSSY